VSTKDRIGWVLIALAVFSLAKGGGGILPVTPAPIDVPGLHVLIVEETDDRDTIDKGQLSVLQSTLVRQEVAAAGGQFRQYDATHTPEAEPWKTAMARPRQSTPWLIVSNPGKGGFEGPLPASIDATKQIIGGLK
jgi:hypothetical protein